MSSRQEFVMTWTCVVMVAALLFSLGRCIHLSSQRDDQLRLECQRSGRTSLPNTTVCVKVTP